MKFFVLYALARLALFACVYGILWLIVAGSLEWSSLSAIYTALIAMVVSSLIAFVALRGLRDKVALQLANRAQRANPHIDSRPSPDDD